MFLAFIKNLKIVAQKDPFYFFLLAFCILLPFQFALNPAAGFDLAIVRVFVPLFFLVWLVLNPKKIAPLAKNNVTRMLFVFLLLAVLSIAYSANTAWSFRKLLFPLSLFPIYLVTVSILDSRLKKRVAVITLLLGATILSWLAILQFTAQFIFGIDAVYAFLAQKISPFFLGHSFSATVLTYPSWLVNTEGVTYMRAVGIFPDPHMLSYYFGVLIPWSVILWILAKRHKAWFFISMLSLIVADVLTFTRGGYIALIAGSMVILPLVSRKTAAKIISCAAILAFLYTIAPHNPVAGRLTSSFDVQEGSNQARLSNWQQALTIISAHPFGVGIGSYSLSIKPQADYREPIYAHNAYLDIASELGIPAVLLFITILLFVFRNFWKLSGTQPFFIAGVSSISIFAVHSLVENPLYSVHIFPLFLIILAFGSCYSDNNNNEKNKPS